MSSTAPRSLAELLAPLPFERSWPLVHVRCRFIHRPPLNGTAGKVRRVTACSRALEELVPERRG